MHQIYAHIFCTMSPFFPTSTDKPAKKAGTLDIDWSFLDSIRVLAIEAPLLPMHRLAYFLNEKARWNLGRVQDNQGCVQDYEGFALMKHILPEDRLNIFLLENKGTETLVSGSGATVDYFLLICGEVARFEEEKEDRHLNFQALSEMIEGIESVFSVYPMNIQSCDPLKQFVLVHQDCFLEF